MCDTKKMKQNKPVEEEKKNKTISITILKNDGLKASEDIFY